MIIGSWDVWVQEFDSAAKQVRLDEVLLHRGAVKTAPFSLMAPRPKLEYARREARHFALLVIGVVSSKRAVNKFGIS